MGLTKKEFIVVADSKKEDLFGRQMNFEYKDVPWCCAICGKQFETYEDLRHRLLPCGCSYDLCESCLNLQKIQK